AVEFFQKAVEKDPRFAAAWAGMPTAYVWGTILRRFPAPSGWISCRDAARKAVDLDPTLAEGYAGLAAVKAHYALDYAGAQQLYEHALEINPREDHALVGSAVLLQALGQFDQAIAFRKRLIEIDPVSASAQWGLANAYLTSGQIDLAAKQVEAVLGMDPNFSEAHIALIRIHIARGEFNQAIAVARKQAENPQNTRALAFL